MTLSTMLKTVLAQAAAGAPPSQPSIWVQVFPLVLIFVVMYFLMIRPQAKQAKQQRALLESLKNGMEVVTSGGIFGRVQAVNDNVVTLEIAQNVRIQIQKAQIAGAVQPKSESK